MKTCFKCNSEKPFDAFYKHSQMKDGYLNKCKECTKKDVNSVYKSNKSDDSFVAKERKRGRDKYRRLYSGKIKKTKRYDFDYAKRYPEKISARSASDSIITDIGYEKHHWSYNKEHWKDIIILDKKWHMKAHRFIIYDQERMMYRRYDNNILLDTKDSHIDFIFHCIENEDD